MEISRFPVGSGAAREPIEKGNISEDVGVADVVAEKEEEKVEEDEAGGTDEEGEKEAEEKDGGERGREGGGE